MATAGPSSPDTQSTASIDGAAAGLSLVCILHCLILPIFAAASPFIAAVSDAEWVHIVVALLALTASATVVVLTPSARNAGFLIPVGLGALLVGGALLLEDFADDEMVNLTHGGCLPLLPPKWRGAPDVARGKIGASVQVLMHNWRIGVMVYAPRLEKTWIEK